MNQMLPYDCIGVIVSFLQSSYIFSKLFFLSKDVQNYFINTYPLSCYNIKFVISKTFKACDETQFPFIVRLYVTQITPSVSISKRIPNVKKVTFFNCKYLDSTKHFKYFGKVEKLYIVINSSAKVKSRYKIKIEDFQHLTSLKTLGLSQIDTLNDRIFDYLGKLKSLKLVRCDQFRLNKLPVTLEKICVNVNYMFSDADLERLVNLEKIMFKDVSIDGDIKEIKRVKKIVIIDDDYFNDKLCLHNSACLEYVEINNCSNFRGKYLSHISTLKKFKIIKNKHVDDKVIKNMRNLETLKVHKCDNIKGKELSVMKKLKKLTLKYQDNIDDSIFKFTPNLKKLLLTKCKLIKLEKNMENLEESLTRLVLSYITIPDISIILSKLRTIRMLKFTATKFEKVFNCDRKIDSLDKLYLFDQKVEKIKNIFKVIGNLELLHIYNVQDINNEDLAHLRKLKVIKIVDNESIDDKVFPNFQLVERLSLLRCSKITNNLQIEGLKRLYQLKINFCSEITGNKRILELIHQKNLNIHVIILNGKVMTKKKEAGFIQSVFKFLFKN